MPLVVSSSLKIDLNVLGPSHVDQYWVWKSASISLTIEGLCACSSVKQVAVKLHIFLISVCSLFGRSHMCFKFLELLYAFPLLCDPVLIQSLPKTSFRGQQTIE